MLVRFRKRTPDRHVFEIVRDDGSVSAIELDTRTFLRHDLMHYVLERRAGLASSLYGTLGSGAEPAKLRMQPGAVSAPDELHATEILVGMLQGAVAKDADAAAFVPLAREYLELQGRPMPAFLTPDFVRGVLADYRRLYAQWQSLRVGGVLELRGG